MRARLRSENGFGMLEMLISLTILNVGVLAVIAAFNSGAISLRRASEISSAAAVGDKQMELYRAIKYTAISLDTASVTAADATYKADAAYTAGTQLTATCSPITNSCNPSRTTTGPDGKSYRVDTYIISQTPTGGRALKLVTVVVRRSTGLKALARVASTFDASTG